VCGGGEAAHLDAIQGHAVGHQKGDLGLSMTTRAGRETLEAKAACVRAVKLPTPDPVKSKATLAD
jgi:hypothetical protein